MYIYQGNLLYDTDSSLTTLPLVITATVVSSSKPLICLEPHYTAHSFRVAFFHSLGSWPIKVGKTKTMHTVYLSEEAHFDVVLGRSFWEARQVKTDPLDPTDVVCGDTGEKIDCELVILKDGKGQIITVT